MSDDRLHHLTKDGSGRWEMRVTVQRDPKRIGEPLRIKLGKISEKDAIRQRDNHLRVLEKVGKVVKLRRQRKKSR